MATPIGAIPILALRLRDLVWVAFSVILLVNALAVEHGDPFATRASLFTAPPSLVTKGSPGPGPLPVPLQAETAPTDFAVTQRGPATPMAIGKESQVHASVRSPSMHTHNS